MNGGFLDSLVHPFNLPDGPRMDTACQTMFDAMSIADHVKLLRFLGLCSMPFSELRAVIFK